MASVLYQNGQALFEIEVVAQQGETDDSAALRALSGRIRPTQAYVDPGKIAFNAPTQPAIDIHAAHEIDDNGARLRIDITKLEVKQSQQGAFCLVIADIIK